MHKAKVALLVATMIGLSAAAPPAPGADATIAIVGATVFDGTGAPPSPATVLIKGDRITAVGKEVKVPRGANILDARGKALLPGFIDVHTHWTPAGLPGTYPQIATAYVRSGVTTVNDFHQAPEAYAPLRDWLRTMAAPHVGFAARISTPGGHGADWADQATTKWVNTPEAARAAIESLEPYKPDLVKAFADGWRYGLSPDNSSMDETTMTAVVQEARKRNWPVLTHTVTVERGLSAARAGVSALAHGLQDRRITEEEVAAIRRSGMAMAPTLAVYDPHKRNGTPLSPDDPRFKQSVRKFGYALANVKSLSDAGVPIAVGTDAGMSGAPHGRSTLRELELLVQAGLTPTQALVAGTRTSAMVMGLEGDRGTIAAGKRADIVLVDGRPWADIADVYKVDRVFVDGKLVSGAGAPPLPGSNQSNRLPSVAVPALLDDFERKDRRSSLDTLRIDTPDGGMDRTVEITQTVAREGGGHALSLSARMAVKDDAYAGFAIPLTQGSITPVRLAGYRGLRFDLRGEGIYSVRINGLDGVWEANVKGSSRWTTVTLSFDQFVPVSRRGKPSPAFTGDGIVQIEVGGSRKAGASMWLYVDNMNFY